MRSATFMPSRPIAELREAIAGIEAAAGGGWGALPFGAAAIDAALSGGGIAIGALHEAAGAAPTLADEAAASMFVAGIAARLPGPVLWCRRDRDLFAPGLAQAGLHPDRVVHAELGTDADILAAMEEGLRVAGIGAVVGEVRTLALAPSRRLQLAAEAGGVTALVLRRVAGAADPGAARTRWRVAPAPSAPLPLPTGLGRARWRLTLDRARGGRPGEWIVEAADAEGRLAMVPDLFHRSAAPGGDRSAAPRARRSAPSRTGGSPGYEPALAG